MPSAMPSAVCTAYKVNEPERGPRDALAQGPQPGPRSCQCGCRHRSVLRFSWCFREDERVHEGLSLSFWETPICAIAGCVSLAGESSLAQAHFEGASPSKIKGKNTFGGKYIWLSTGFTLSLPHTYF